jgi:hypothetical protein
MKAFISHSLMPSMGMLLLAVAAPVSAHHSPAAYDMNRTMSAPATVKEFRWGAPHSSAVFLIKGANGKPEEVVMVSSTPATFMKQGFKPRDFKVGDKVEVTWHPAKNGSGGQLDSMKLPDGRTFKETEFTPSGRPVSGEAGKPGDAASATAPTE